MEAVSPSRAARRTSNASGGPVRGIDSESSGPYSAAVTRTACKLQPQSAGMLGLAVATLLSSLEAKASDANSEAMAAGRALCAGLQFSEEGRVALASAAASSSSLWEYISEQDEADEHEHSGSDFASSKRKGRVAPVVLALRSSYAGDAFLRVLVGALSGSTLWGERGPRLNESVLSVLGLDCPPQVAVAANAESAMYLHSIGLDRVRLARAVMASCSPSSSGGVDQPHVHCLGHDGPVETTWDDEGVLSSLYKAAKASWVDGLTKRIQKDCEHAAAIAS